MPKFAVFLHGTGCRIGVAEGKWPRRNSTIEAWGFYTTRFVEGASPGEAVSDAIELVQEEVKNLNQSDPPPTISVESVVEDEVGYAKYAPGGGFSWYREEE